MRLHNETKIRLNDKKKEKQNKTKSLPLLLYMRIQINRHNTHAGFSIAGIG